MFYQTPRNNQLKNSWTVGILTSPPGGFFRASTRERLQNGGNGSLCSHISGNRSMVQGY